jgi:hypothetical protein
MDFDYLLSLIDDELVNLESVYLDIETLQDIFVERIAPYIKMYINSKKNAASI